MGSMPDRAELYMAIEWATENVRVSLFSNTVLNLTDQDWRNITGQDEAETRKAVLGGRVFSGHFDGHLLSVASTGNRADIVISSAPEALPGLPTIGSWETIRDRFVDFTSNWITTVKFPIVRIAFGAVLLCPLPERREAYLYLQQLLASVKIDPDHMRELIFRVNWPTKSEVIKGLLINRITQWNAIRLLVKALQLNEPQSDLNILETNAVRLEIDHSTDETRSEQIDAKKVIPLFEELVTLASENAAKGERP